MEFFKNDIFSGGGIDPAAPLATRIKGGGKGGLLGAAGLSVIVLIIFGLAKGTDDDLRTLFPFIVLYFAGGITGGVAYGALRPLLGRTLFSTFVFVSCLFSVLFTLLMVTIGLLEGEPLRIKAFVAVVPITSVMMGAIFTPIFWGRIKGRPWAWPVFLLIFLISFGVRNAGRYIEANPGTSFLEALLRQWPLVAFFVFLNYAIQASRKARRL